MNNQSHTSNNSSEKKSSSSITAFIWVAMLGILVIIMAKQQKQDIPYRAMPDLPPMQIAQLVRTETDQAFRRNLNALQTFEMEMRRILHTHEKKLEKAAEKAAQKASGHHDCCRVIYYLAWDKVNKKNQTDDFLKSQTDYILKPAVNELARDIQLALSTLEAELKAGTLELAEDLAARGITPQNSRRLNTHSQHGNQDLDQALTNLGWNGVAVGIMLPLDAVAIARSHTGQKVWHAMKELAARIFQKQVTKVAASGAAVLADGPFPLGDAVAVVGLVWTGWDVVKGRKEFQNNLDTAFSNQLRETNHSLHKQAVSHAKQMIQSYQKLQDRVGSEALANLR